MAIIDIVHEKLDKKTNKNTSPSIIHNYVNM